MDAANRSSWKTLPVPEQKNSLGFTSHFSDLEAERIQHGLVPQQMEDKWFIYSEQGWVYFHRSWTGACVYWLKLDGSPMGVHVVESWVNADTTQYQSPGPEFDRKLIEFLIDAFLLGKPAVFPKFPVLTGSATGVFQHHLVGRVFPETGGGNGMNSD